MRLSALRVEVERDWQQVQRHARTCGATDPALGPPHAALVALALDHAYQAFEQVLVRVEQALRLPGRTGQHWHRQLLADASAPLPQVRPALLPKVSSATGSTCSHFATFSDMLTLSSSMRSA